MSKVAVIIPAAGAGKRFGGSVKKPFTQLDGRPLFIRTLELFANRPDVCQVLLAVGPEDYDVVREKYAANLMFMNVRLVRGADERFKSVQAALSEVAADAELVCVHDAVRPCVLPRWIDEVFAAASASGGAILATPLTGTIKRVAGKLIEGTVSRAQLYEAQTPQVFRAELLRAAYAALPADAAPTDDAQVVEMLGKPVAIVEADRRNIKVTTGSDMTLASAIIRDMEREARPNRPSGAFEEAQW